MWNFVIFLVQFQVILAGFKTGCAANPYLTILNIDSAFKNGGRLMCLPADSKTTITMGKAFRISANDSLTEATLKNSGGWYAGAKTLVIPFDENFFGVYYCKGVLDGKTTIVYTTVVGLRQSTNSEVIPTNEKTSITASVGDSVTLSFNVRASGNHMWRKDGELLDNYENLYDDSSITFTSVSVDDGGIYELYIDGHRDEYKHSFIELIVRGCPVGRWGAPRCTGVCNNCYNGGVCENETGRCVCPPGFKGENCEETCGGNRYGITCSKRCIQGPDPNLNYVDACDGDHYCLPNPYGCGCITGYTGLKCLTGCGVGKFGAGCNQECHCELRVCNQYTGECTSGTCASGWTGSNCQVPKSCPVGYFGTSCTSICHCRNNAQCDRSTGVCSNGECAIGYYKYEHLFCEVSSTQSASTTESSTTMGSTSSLTENNSPTGESNRSSIPGFMIALVVVLFIIIILLSLVFYIYYRYNQSNGNNMHKSEVKVTTNTRVEEENELDNYTKLITDNLAKQTVYDVIQTETQQCTYDHTMQTTSRLDVTTAEKSVRITKDKNTIPMKHMGHESDSGSNSATPHYANIK